MLDPEWREDSDSIRAPSNCLSVKNSRQLPRAGSGGPDEVVCYSAR